MTEDVRSDEQLLASGEADAFALFYRRHAPALLAYMVRRAGNAEAAADLTAETFAAALAGARRYREARGTAVSWLYGIARHQLYRYFERGRVERRARERYGISVALDDEALERIEALAALDTVRVRLNDELDALPPEQSAALRARVLHDREYGDIARSMAITEPAARQRVSRALARLRAALGGIE